MSDQLGLDFETQPRRRREAALESLHLHGGSPTVAEAQENDARAVRQEQRLLAWWKEHPTERITRYDAAAILGCKDSSGGRALSNLRDAGLARKRSDLRVDGPYCATCHPYEFTGGTNG